MTEDHTQSYIETCLIARNTWQMKTTAQNVKFDILQLDEIIVVS